MLSLYLLANHQTDGLPGCVAGGGCDRVQQSPWSVLWGYPVAAWGAATYVLLLGLCVWPKRRAGVAALPVVATIGFAISAYLTSITWHEIKAWCPWCLASLALVGVLSVRGWLRSEALLRPCDPCRGRTHRPRKYDYLDPAHEILSSLAPSAPNSTDFRFG